MRRQATWEINFDDGGEFCTCRREHRKLFAADLDCDCTCHDLVCRVCGNDCEPTGEAVADGICKPCAAWEHEVKS